MQPALAKAISRYHPQDQALIAKAYRFAQQAHQNQRRKTGDPYLNHCVEVALKLAALNLDAVAVVAGLLHDVPEDTKFNLETVKREFGNEVAKLVDGLTKLERVKVTKKWLIFGPQEQQELPEFERYIETLRKMFLATAKDLRVILIKLADRLHNMETIGGLHPERRKSYAMETLELYAPVAYRLGMNELKGQLEDLAFPHAYPTQYNQIRKLTGQSYQRWSVIAQWMREQIQKILKTYNIAAQTDARPKRLYSLWKKLKRYNNNLQEIYDLVAVRVLVPDIETCYRALDLIHQRYPPIAYRIKDYIAHPKPNGYQSLHTTVQTKDKHIIEIQIRTYLMHEQAEYGVATHWTYKSLQEGRFQSLLRKFNRPKESAWIKEVAQIGKRLKDPAELAEHLKINFFGDRIFAVTPKGDIKDLPDGASALDFAYAVHSEIGNHAVGAKVNNKMVKLTTILQNGDQVEILTSRNARPSQDSLNLVKTHHARSHIRRALRLRGLIPNFLKRR